jgi:hypothetical protein
LILQVYVLVVTSESRNLECAVDSNVWMYCIDLIIANLLVPIIPTLAVLVSKWISLLQPVVLGLFAAWGAYLWSILDEQCYLSSNEKYWMIILLFKVYVVLIFIATFAALNATVMALFMGNPQPAAAGATNDGAGGSNNYKPIPESERDQSQQNAV